MSRHLDLSPQPVDPVWYRHFDYLHLGCACGHRAALQIGPLARRHGMARETKLYQVIDRMLCSRCGGRPIAVAVRARGDGPIQTSAE